jgi:uncharacterized protein YggT (Ycf19 family)
VDILMFILYYSIRFYQIIVFVYVILSWFVYGTQNMIVRRIYWTAGQLVDPALAPIRQLLNPLMRGRGLFSRIDISPIILLIFLMLLEKIIARAS